MHSHLLHYVIKLNGPGPNTALGYSHFYSSSPLIPLSSSPAAAGAGVPGHLHGHLLSTHRVGSPRRQELLHPSHFGLRNEHRLYTDDRRNCPAVLENLALRWKRGCGRSRRREDVTLHVALMGSFSSFWRIACRGEGPPKAEMSFRSGCIIARMAAGFL